MPSSDNTILYVYGIVPAELSHGSLPAGLDDATVMLERHDRLAAVVSALDDARYAPHSIETNSGDVDWLSPRAVAHDRVLTWASDHGAVVPLPMFSMFSSREAVRTMLEERSAALSSTLARVGQGREYALRVYRVDAELLAAVPSLSPRLRALADTAAAASPGQRYLLERKLDAEKKTELRGVSQQLVDGIVATLAPCALEHVRSPIPRIADATAATAARGTMVLNAAFLIAAAGMEHFQRTLTSLVERHTAHGLRFDFTGPWPPYHFVTLGADDE